LRSPPATSYQLHFTSGFQLPATGFFMNWLPPNGALHGAAFDHLLRLNLTIAFWLFVAAQILLVIALLRRWLSRQDSMQPGLQQKTPASKSPLRILLLLDYALLLAITGLYVWMVASSHRLWAASHETPSAAALQVEVTGVQFQWYFRYPGQDGIFGTTRPTLVSAPTGNPLGLDPADPHSTDDIVSSILILPAGQPVHITLRSQDVIHGLSIPGMRLKQDAIPGMPGDLQFTPQDPGDYPILCTQVCGLGHSRMQARLRVVTPDQFRTWLATREQAALRVNAAADSPVNSTGKSPGPTP
jgi:cytochrome c oxidase subunit II